MGGNVTEVHTTLVWFNRAREPLAQAKSLDEVKSIRDKAEALRVYIKQAGESLAMQNWGAEIKLRAERRAGELLGAMDRHKGAATPFQAETASPLRLKATLASTRQRLTAGKLSPACPNLTSKRTWPTRRPKGRS
jgi:hypothetical protein